MRCRGWLWATLDSRRPPYWHGDWWSSIRNCSFGVSLAANDGRSGSAAIAVPDGVVSALDRDAGRLVASWLSRELLIANLDIATSVSRTGEDQRQLAGDARLLLPFEGCIECVGGIADPTETFYEFATPPGSLYRGEPLICSVRCWLAGRSQQSDGFRGGIELWMSLLRGTISSYW